jgi:DNA (cytosine-5)-methyltransferase 1
VGRNITAIDLFSGAGGLSLSAIDAGFDITAAIELDKEACKTYSRNIIDNYSPNTKLFQADILKDIDPNILQKELSIKSGTLDLLLGGPPCQGFSSHRINGSGVDDPRNELLLRYFEFVKTLRPKFFLVENVTGLLWKRHSKYLEQFKQLANLNDYSLIGPMIINARDFGVAQNRKRVFILGVDNNTNLDIDNILWPPAPTHGPNSSKDWTSSSTIFEEPPAHILSELDTNTKSKISRTLTFGKPVSSSDPCSVHMNHSAPLIERFSLTPINGSREDIEFRLPCHTSHSGHKDVYGRIKLAEPSNTMTTGCYNPSKGRFVHPWLNHGITLRHAARFQTFPDDFNFSGSLSNKSKQIGNSVPPLLGKKLLQPLMQYLSAQKNN